MMAVRKRGNPFIEETSFKAHKPSSAGRLVPVTPHSGFQAYTSNTTPRQAEPATFRRCNVCLHSRLTYPCCYCEHSACDQCLKQCEGCLDTLCTFCTLTDYSAKYERQFCLPCNSRILKAEQPS
eukprot:Rmarinus@m.19115